MSFKDGNYLPGEVIVSKGLGRVERRVLEAVKLGHCEPYVVTCFVFGLLNEVGDIIARPTIAQHKSTLRAINRLSRKKLVKIAKVKTFQYRENMLDNAAWQPYTFPDEGSLMAFRNNPPGYVLEMR